MEIGEAVKMLMRGRKVARKTWRESDIYLMAQFPDDFGMMTLPFIYIRTADNQLVPWVCTQVDLLAEDWILI